VPSILSLLTALWPCKRRRESSIAESPLTASGLLTIQQIWLAECEATRTSRFAGSSPAASREIQSQNGRRISRRERGEERFGMDTEACLVSLPLSPLANSSTVMILLRKARDLFPGILVYEEPKANKHLEILKP
jgi:hypothetical protein